MISDPKFAQASNHLVWAKDLTSTLSKQLTWANGCLQQETNMQHKKNREKNAERAKKKKERRKSGAEALQSCDRGSHPSSFLLMAIVQHLVMDNKKRRPIIYRTKPDLNKTFKEATKSIEVAQVSIANQKNTDASIKNLEVQVGQLAKQIFEHGSGSFQQQHRAIIAWPEDRSNFQEEDEYMVDPVDYFIIGD
ncbi:hypothetical protein JHK82_055560 [Glycine max]|nr:hypothetical protein JHK82_055560 [Glycine max]